MASKSEQPKTLTSARIRAYNRACADIVCNGACDSIGWCEEVYRRVRKKASDRIRAVSAFIFLMGIGSTGFLIGLGITRLLELVL